MFIEVKDRDMIPHYQFMDLVSVIKLTPTAPKDFLSSLTKYRDLAPVVKFVKK